MPALADVGTVRLFAHGMQAERPHQSLEAVVVFGTRRTHLQPLGLWNARKFIRALFAAANEVHRNNLHEP